MEKSTIIRIAAFVALGVIVSIAASYVLNSCDKSRQEKKIQALETRKVKIINADSLRDVIESRILGSLKKEVDRQDAKIAALTQSLTVTRRKNEKMQKRLDSIRVFMPDF